MPRKGLLFLVMLGLAVLWLLPRPGTASPGDTTRRLSSSAVAITPAGDVLLVVNPDSNSITLLDPTTHHLLAEIPVGIDPRSVAVTPDGLYALVANQGSDNLALIDIQQQQQKGLIPTGDRPVGVAISPDGRLAAVSELGDDQVRFIHLRTLTTLSTVSVFDRPYGLAFTPDGSSLVVAHLLSGRVSVLQVLPFNHYLPLILSGNVAAVTASTTRSLAASLLEPPWRNLQSVKPETIDTWLNVAPAPSVVINASGTRAYLPQTMANGLGLNVRFDTTVFPKVSVLNLQTMTHQTSEHISLPETDTPVGLPWDAALTRGDQELWVVNAASNDLSVIDISEPTFPHRAAHIPVGDNPRGIVFSPDGSTVYVNNTLAGTVSVIDTQTYTVSAVIPVTTIPLPPVLLNGKRLFHSSATSELSQARWISCNTCHVEGEHDGRTWMLPFLGDIPPGEEPLVRRNTTSLLGMIETYPLRWSAEWDESADSEFSIRFEQFGTGLIVGDMYPTLGLPNQGRSDDLDGLAAFIDSLAVPLRAYSLDSAEQRGRQIFESAETGCAECHPAPTFTDLLTHDVGTADGEGEWFGPFIDTPTLRFLYDSAPYLHDGSAPTLSDVLVSHNGDDQHGVTSHLTGAELADLVAFLLSLPFQEAP